MKRKLLLVLAFIALPGFASALGLGKLQLNSALNQPFDARIELLSTSASELQSLHVGLADTEAFRRAKIDRPFVLSKLKFAVIENENDPDYIQISSRDVIREPHLNFLLEVNWSTGRMYREYTVLLDPPLYDPNVNRSRQTQSYSSPSSSEDSYIDDDAEAVSDSVSSISPQISYNDSQYGPTDSSDTLWAIATQVRPDSSVSVQQMMMALLRSNPEAFINSNINGLKRGQILNIPSRDEISDLSSQEAISEVGAQNSDWGGSGIAADAVSERADSMSMSDDDSNSFDDEPSSADMISDDESELRLVAASSDGEGIAQSGGDSGQASNIDLTLANEQLQTVTQENEELQDRMQEAETIISDLKRLISLKDDELATLQNQMAADGMDEQDDVVESIADAADFMDEEVDEEETALDVEQELSDEEFTETEEEYAIDEDGLAEGFLEEDEESALAMEEDEVDEEETAVEEEFIESEAPVNDIVAPPGIVDQVLGFITDNLFAIAGALGGLIVAIVALLFVSRRKQNAANEEVLVSATDFPDFEETADAVSDLPAETGPAMNIDGGESEDETVLPVGEDEEGDEEANDKSAFVTPPDPQPEAAPEPEEPEEDPLAEVNVFLAYEHFDQAEEFVREAISGDPENLEFHAKLLEVFYAASDKKGYEDAAQLLHDKVNGEGPHWEMAQAMWQEMSPNRTLFEEGADDELTAGPAEAAGAVGGFMDITAEEDEDAAAASVDFDLGMDAGEAEGSSADSEDVLDITTDGEDVSILDVTTASAVGQSSSDEDLLDVTAAVGLDFEEFAEEIAAATEGPMLDITSSSVSADMGSSTVDDDDDDDDDDDVLDISHTGNEDLLDVTANANLEAEGLEEDLLDVTSAGAGAADGEELLEVSAEEGATEDNAIDFDIGGMDIDVPETSEEESEDESGDDNIIDFDVDSSDAEEGIELDIDTGDESAEEIGELDVALEAEDEGDGIELDMSIGDDADESLDILDDTADDSLEIDLSIDEDDDSPDLDIGELEVDSGSDDALDLDLTLDDEEESSAEKVPEIELDMDFDLEIQEDEPEADDMDMEGTVEMPSLSVEGMGLEIDDDDDDHTVFVPRAGAADEQSDEDEIATKLDLAKAYVELGDGDSAKGILDDVLADGSDEQKQTAQDLLNQLN